MGSGVGRFGDCHDRGFSASVFTLPALLLAVRAMIRALLLATLLLVWLLSCDEAVLISGTSSFAGDTEAIDFIP